MNDLELADKVQRFLIGDPVCGGFSPEEWQQIIAALRRGPDFDKLHLQLTEIRATLDAIETQHDERPLSGEMVMVPRELVEELQRILIPSSGMAFKVQVERAYEIVRHRLLSAAEAEGRKG